MIGDKIATQKKIQSKDGVVKIHIQTNQLDSTPRSIHDSDYNQDYYKSNEKLLGDKTNGEFGSKKISLKQDAVSTSNA